MKEGIACYQDYLRGLLDLTDNRVGDTIVPPPRVARHDADDPYLVVAADKGTATFSDYANGDQPRVRILAGRRIRIGRVGRVRPQGDGHHGARRLGIGQAPFPRDGHRHADDRLHRRGHRRHVGRRIRQRHAAVAPHPARRRVRPPAHLSRSESRRRSVIRRARAAVQAAALVVGRLRREAAVARRRHPSAQREVDRDHPRGRQGARDRRSDR